jgi:hypothetical protein
VRSHNAAFEAGQGDYLLRYVNILLLNTVFLLKSLLLDGFNLKVTIQLQSQRSAIAFGKGRCWLEDSSQQSDHHIQ